MKIAAFFGSSSKIDAAYGPAERWELQKHCRFVAPVVDLEDFLSRGDSLREVEVIFSTWTMPCLEASHLDQMPALRVVFFAAGSVRHFAGPLLERNIVVVSAWRANAIPTAEFAFGQILLSMKGCFRNQREYRTPDMLNASYRGPGNYQETVALLGVGAVGTRVAELLRLLDVTVLACDPFLSRERAEMLGVERVSLEDAFSRAFVVSNHMPLLPETEGILTAGLFASMRRDATFINTARGVIVDEPGMVSVLLNRPDLQALLDVSAPEPPDADSPLFSMPNVFLTGHMAGAANNEVRRLGWCCVQQFLEWQRGQPPEHAVTPELFASMA